MTIEQRIKNNEFASISEYEKELRIFQQYFLENGPQGPNRRIIMLEYCQKALNETAGMFSRKLTSEMELQKTLMQDATQKLESQIAEMKEEARRDNEEAASKLRNLESLKAELTAKEQGLRENYNTLLKEKAASEKELSEKIDEERKTAARNIKDMKDKMAQQEEQTRIIQEKVITSESDFGKEKALLEQKIAYLEKNLEETKTKEKEYGNEIKNIKRDSSATTKEISAKYEGQIKEMQGKLDALKDQMIEMESKMADAEQKFEMEKSQWQDNLTNESSKKEEANRIVAEFKAQIEAQSNKFKADLKAQEEKFALERTEAQTKIAELEASYKGLDEQIKTQKVKVEKEEAIKKQNKEFLELQLIEVKKQLEESRKAHETIVKAMDTKDNNDMCKEETTKQLDVLKEEHLNEIREIENNHENTRKRLTDQVEQLSEKVNDLETKLALLQTDHEKENESQKEQQKTLELENQKLAQQIKTLDQKKLQLLEETENNYKEAMHNLEVQADEKSKKLQEEMRDAQKRSEESLAQLRNFYEMEKERLEARIIDEKEKAQRRFAQQLEECEQKLKDEQQQHAEETEMLQNDLTECETQHREIITQLEQEAGLNKQKIQTLEEQLKDSKEHVTRVQAMNNNALEQQVNSFAEERKSLIEKIERLSHELTTKERELTTFENKNDSLKQELERNTKTNDEWKTEKLSEKNGLIEKVEALKQKNQQISDELMQRKLESSKEAALSKQHEEFQDKKIKELQTTIEELTSRYEEKIKIQKQEASQQLKDTIDRLSQDKEQYEQKYDLKRKALKELEANVGKQTSKLEKEKAVLTEKLASLTTKKEETDKQYQDEIKTLQGQICQLKEALSKDRASILQDNEKLKKQVLEFDKELSEVQANYQCDKELWNGKCHFLEQQRDQSRGDMAEAQKKFEQTLEQIQRRNSIEKEKQEQNHTAFVTTLDQRYKNQIKEQSEAYEHKISEIIQKNKQLEKEIKNQNDQLQFEQRGKQSEQSMLDKKISDYQEMHSKLSKELEDVKSDRDRKIMEYQKLFERERDGYKQKLQEAESKFSEADSKRATLYLETEKERARWSVERDQLICAKNQAQETIALLEKKRDTMAQELNNMKSLRTSRKPMYAGVTNSTASVHGTSRFSSIANGKSKENLQGIKSYQVEEKAPSQHDSVETDSNHSGKYKMPTKSTLSFLQKNEDGQ